MLQTINERTYWSVIKSRVNPCVNHSDVSSQNIQEERFIHEKCPVKLTLLYN